MTDQELIISALVEYLDYLENCFIDCESEEDEQQLEGNLTRVRQLLNEFKSGEANVYKLEK